MVSSSASASDKVKSRLEQLDDVDGGGLQEMLDLSQQEYITRIEELNAELTHAWENEQRVKALKIAIQCAKLLADTKVIQFYPSKFVLITDILDTFGKLVAERIYRKSAYYPPGSSVPKNLPPDFTPDMVPASAKETCRNWFFKIASIRELVPRLYVETVSAKRAPLFPHNKQRTKERTQSHSLSLFIFCFYFFSLYPSLGSLLTCTFVLRCCRPLSLRIRL